MTPKRGNGDEQTSCFGKEKLSAQKAQQLARRGHGKGASAYRCEHCHQWHVGHSSSREGRRKTW